MAKWGNSPIGSYDNLDFDRVMQMYYLIEKYERKQNG